MTRSYHAPAVEPHPPLEQTPKPDAEVQARWKAAVGHIFLESFPVATEDGWAYVSRTAHKLFWDIKPRNICTNEDGYLFNGVADGWPAKNGYTLEEFEACLVELEDAGAIIFEDGPGLYTDGTPCRQYTVYYPGVERLYFDEEWPSASEVKTESKQTRQRRSRAQLVARYNATCVYCKKVGTQELGPDGRPWHGDHVWARSQGGRGGIVLACATCNIRKHNMAATEFLAKLAAEGIGASNG